MSCPKEGHCNSKTGTKCCCIITENGMFAEKGIESWQSRGMVLDRQQSSPRLHQE